MAYTSSTSVSTLDIFITAFTAFAVTYAGFADEGNFTDSGTTVTIISKGGMYWSFYTVDFTQNNSLSAVQFRMTYVKPTTLAEVLSVAGTKYPNRMTSFVNTSGPYVKYYLYTEGTCVHCVLEVYSGIFNHLSFGNITKLGTWTGGEYATGGAEYASFALPGFSQDAFDAFNSRPFDGGNNSTLPSNPTYGSYYAGYIRRENGSIQTDETDFSRLGNVEVDNQMSLMNIGSDIMDGIYENTPNQFNLRSPALPMYCRIWNDTKQTYGLQGYVPEVRVVNIKNIADAELVETDWQAFPLIQRDPGDDTLAPLSYNWGLMYQRTGSAV